jgi:Ser/Thr protein kinase RdoA (MazF antagonist)
VGDVHALPTESVVSASAPADVVAYAREWTDGIVARLLALEEHLPPGVRDEARTARLSAERRLVSVADAPGFAGGTLALLHADLSPSNVVWRPDPLLIDWEYARLGDPADEIGYVFGQHGLDRSQRDAFWRGYRTARSSEGIQGIEDRVRWWEPMGLLGSATWWLERWRERTEADAHGVAHPSAPKAAAYYLDHALSRLRSLQLLDGR